MSESMHCGAANKNLISPEMLHPRLKPNSSLLHHLSGLKCRPTFQEISILCNFLPCDCEALQASYLVWNNHLVNLYLPFMLLNQIRIFEAIIWRCNISCHFPHHTNCVVGRVDPLGKQFYQTLECVIQWACGQHKQLQETLQKDSW